MHSVFHKLVGGLLIVTLGLACLPLGTAFAAAPTPQAPSPDLVPSRLERVFARQNRIIDRLGKLYAGADQGFTKIQNLLDQARARGLDVSQLQAAFDAFKNALPAARPFYLQAKAAVDAHAGFDAAGNLIDVQAARSTVQSVHASLVQFRTALNGTAKALRQAIRAFRAAHPRPTPTPAAP